MTRGAITTLRYFLVARILGLSQSRQMYSALGPKFSLGVLASLVLIHEESMESKREIFSCKAPTLSSSWI